MTEKQVRAEMQRLSRLEERYSIRHDRLVAQLQQKCDHRWTRVGGLRVGRTEGYECGVCGDFRRSKP
jgi:hypothetical protein